MSTLNHHGFFALKPSSAVNTAQQLLESICGIDGMSRLYMTPHFFEDKPVAQLLGVEIEAAHLNDDCLGRCLDKIAPYGVTKRYFSSESRPTLNLFWPTF